MPAFVALLRAVNVGGTGRLPMADLVAMCGAAGFRGTQTYVASGNAVFESDMDEAGVKAALEAQLARYAGKPVGVLVRTANEMAAVLARNPFQDHAADRTVAIFLDDAPPAAALDDIRGRTEERLALGAREIYIAYGHAMGTSKLVVPAARTGTARNMNTVARLVAMTGGTGMGGP